MANYNQVQALPEGAVFLVDTVPKLPDLTETGPALWGPAIIDWDRVHPLTRNLTLLDRRPILKPRLAPSAPKRHI